MKNTLTVLLSGLLLCGCSKKPAVDFVVAGKDIAWRDGSVLRVDKRDGTSLEGIHITHSDPNGDRSTLIADTGTISSGSIADVTDKKFVKIILHNVHVEKDIGAEKRLIDSKDMTIEFEK